MKDIELLQNALVKMEYGYKMEYKECLYMLEVLYEYFYEHSYKEEADLVDFMTKQITTRHKILAEQGGE